MAIGDFYTIQAQWRLTNGQLTAQNQFHFKQTVAVVFDTPEEDLVEAFKAEIEPAYKACVSGQWGIVNYVVKEQPSGLTLLEEAVPDHSGLLSGDALPPQVATILSFRSTQPGRRGKGRVYLPPANEASSGTIGTPSTTLNDLVTDLGDELLALESNVLYAGWQWSAWSEANQAGYEVITYTPRFQFATQRGRTR